MKIKKILLGLTLIGYIHAPKVNAIEPKVESFCLDSSGSECYSYVFDSDSSYSNPNLYGITKTMIEKTATEVWAEIPVTAKDIKNTITKNTITISYVIPFRFKRNEKRFYKFIATPTTVLILIGHLDCDDVCEFNPKATEYFNNFDYLEPFKAFKAFPDALKVKQ